MIRVYTEKDFLETILFEEEKYPTIFNIIQYHSEICLNMTDEELMEEAKKQDFIFEFLNSKGGKGITAYKSPFQNIDVNAIHLLDDLRAIYILDIDIGVANQLSEEYGTIVLSGHHIKEDVLKFDYDRDLPKDTICEKGDKIGWHELLDITLPPFNSLVISDEYLFKNENGIRGEKNVLQFIKAILPKTMKTDFHLLIIAPENELKDRTWCEQLCGRIKSAIKNMKLSYVVQFEMVFSETMHKRIASSNCFNIVPDKGFCVFKTADLKTVLADTDISIQGLFSRSSPRQGNTGLGKANFRLKIIADCCKSVKEYISNRSDDKNKRIFGDCAKDKTINNRLIKEFS